MIPWWTLLIAFYFGVAFGWFGIALMSANGRDPTEDDEQAAYLTRGYEEHA